MALDIEALHVEVTGIEEGRISLHEASSQARNFYLGLIRGREMVDEAKQAANEP